MSETRPDIDRIADIDRKIVNAYKHDTLKRLGAIVLGGAVGATFGQGLNAMYPGAPGFSKGLNVGMSAASGMHLGQHLFKSRRKRYVKDLRKKRRLYT